MKYQLVHRLYLVKKGKKSKSLLTCDMVVFVDLLFTIVIFGLLLLLGTATCIQSLSKLSAEINYIYLYISNNTRELNRKWKQIIIIDFVKTINQTFYITFSVTSKLLSKVRNWKIGKMQKVLIAKIIRNYKLLFHSIWHYKEYNYSPKIH